MPDATPAQPLTDADFTALRAEHKRNKLALAVQQQRSQLRALSQSARGRALSQRDALESGYYDTGNYINFQDYFADGPYGIPLVPTPWLSTRADRDLGRDRPVFQNEWDLAAYRGMARLLLAYNGNAIGLMENLTSYVVGEGTTFTVAPKPEVQGAAVRRIVYSVQCAIESFLERNDYSGELAEERFQRSRGDGEYFVGLWHRGRGVVDCRMIEPEQVTQPGAVREIEEWLGEDHRAVDWTFGVCADDGDSQAIHGYYIQWTNRDTDWDFLPGGNEPFFAPGSQNSWCEHVKSNVTRNVKRGVTDFLPNRELFDMAKKIQKNMGLSGGISSAIAWIIEHAPGVLTSQIQTMIQGDSYGSYQQTTQSGTQTSYIKNYNGGTILHTPQGQGYKSAPGAENAGNYIDLVDAMLGSAAVRWSMPKHMITGSADDINYASILEAGAPFEKRAKRNQNRMVASDLRVLWKVIDFACQAGLVTDDAGNPLTVAQVKRLVEIQASPASIAVRDRLKDAEVNEIEKRNGVLSAKTWAAESGRDYEQEVKNGAKDEGASGSGRDGGDGSAGKVQIPSGTVQPPSGEAPTPKELDHQPGDESVATESVVESEGAGDRNAERDRVASLVLKATQIMFDPQTGVYP